MSTLIEILEEKGIGYKTTNNPSQILITCTNPDHNDKHPSLSYDLENNIFNCWSCGFRGGQRKFLRSIGVDTSVYFESKQSYKVIKLRKKLDNIMSLNSVRMPYETRPVIGSFRNIPKETLANFNAFFTTELGLEDYVCFPIYQFDKLRFIEGRYRFKNDKKSKYLRRPMNVTVTDVAFPIDKLEATEHIILVEGIFDMLNMWQHGFHNVLCIFGSQNFGKRKIALLERLNTLSVVLMMDGDEAGRKATPKIKALLEKKDIQTHAVHLPDNVDPGNLSLETIQYYLKDIG